MVTIKQYHHHLPLFSFFSSTWCLGVGKECGIKNKERRTTKEPSQATIHNAIHIKCNLKAFLRLSNLCGLGAVSSKAWHPSIRPSVHLSNQSAIQPVIPLSLHSTIHLPVYLPVQRGQGRLYEDSALRLELLHSIWHVRREATPCSTEWTALRPV